MGLINGIFSDLLTSLKEGTRRIRVDVGQTGFWENREFRLNEPIPTTGKVIRVTAPIDFLLQLQQIMSVDGEVTMLAYRAEDGAEGGTWSPSKYYARNNQTSFAPAYVGQIAVDVGGTFTPTDAMNYKEKLTAKAATATAQVSSVGTNAVKERGLPSGTYYLVFSGGGEGDYNLLLEERP